MIQINYFIHYINYNPGPFSFISGGESDVKKKSPEHLTP